MKAPYGREMDTVGPEERSLPSLNVTVGLRTSSLEWMVELTRYKSVVLSYVSPKACSKISHADGGSHICGTVESIKERIPVVSGVTSP